MNLLIVIPAGVALFVLVGGIGQLSANEPFLSSLGKFLLHEFPELTIKLTGVLFLIWFGCQALMSILSIFN